MRSSNSSKLQLLSYASGSDLLPCVYLFHGRATGGVRNRPVCQLSGNSRKTCNTLKKLTRYKPTLKGPQITPCRNRTARTPLDRR